MLIVKIITPLVLCLTYASLHDIPIPKVSQDSSLTNILSEIIQKDESLVIVSRSTEDNVIDGISKFFSDKMRFIVKRQASPATTWEMTGSYTVLILASSMTDIADVDTTEWITASKVIVVYLYLRVNGKNTSINPFPRNDLWTFAELDVHQIYKLDDGIYEFARLLYGGDRLRLINGCEVDSLRILDKRNLESKCTITVGVHTQEPYSFYSEVAGFSKGIDIDLAKALSKCMNFDLELKAIANADVNESNFDLIIGTCGDFNKSIEKLSLRSIDFHSDYLTWCIKRAELIRPWRSFFMIATWKVWVIAVIGVYVTAISLFAFYTYYHHPENFHYCTGVSTLLLFGVPVPYNPTHGIARIHFGILLIYGLLAVIAINCFLTSVMTTPRYQYQVHSANDLMYYNYKIMINVELVALNYLGDDKMSSYIKANYEHCDDMDHCLNQLFERSDIAVIVPRKFAKHFQFKTKKPIFCFVDSESFNRVTRTINLGRVNRHLKNGINLFIRQAMETGHLLKWESINVGRKIYEADASRRPVVLTLEHLSGAILIYVVAMMAAILCFIGEQLAFQSARRGHSRAWKWFDKFVFSMERTVWRNRPQAKDEQK